MVCSQPPTLSGRSTYKFQARNRINEAVKTGVELVEFWMEDLVRGRAVFAVYDTCSARARGELV